MKSPFGRMSLAICHLCFCCPTMGISKILPLSSYYFKCNISTLSLHDGQVDPRQGEFF